MLTLLTQRSLLLLGLRQRVSTVCATDGYTSSKWCRDSKPGNDDKPHARAGTLAAAASFFDEAQRRFTALGLRRWRWQTDDASFEQNLPHNLPYEIADTGGGDVPREQLNGVRL